MTSSINFVLRLSHKEGRQQGSLCVRVVHARRSRTVAVGCRLYPEEWDFQTGTIVKPTVDNERANELRQQEIRMNNCAKLLQEIIGSLQKQGRYTVDDIMTRYCRRTDSNKLSGYVESLADGLEQAGQFRLLQAFRTVANELVKFNRGEDIPLTHINACLAKGFENDLRRRGRAANTISFYTRNLRSLYNKAVKARRIAAQDEDPFAGVYTKVKATAKRALTVEETTSLYDIDFEAIRARYAPGSAELRHVESLYFAWRLFMFCFMAQGMCFVDMAYLRKDNIKNGVCRYYRRKTGQQVEVTVHEGMQRIIDSFADDVRNSPYLFPIIKHEGAAARRDYESALRTQNRRLKALAKLAGIEKRVSTHVSRHTFATITRNSGLPTGVISEMLGHTTEKMTHKYFASFDRSQFESVPQIIATALSRPINQPLLNRGLSAMRL